MFFFFFFFERKLEFANSFEGIYIYIYVCMYVCMEGRDRVTQGGHGPSRFLFLKLRVYMFYDIFRIWAKENYF